MIEHIDGIDVEFVAQCLGVDPKKYKYHSEKKNQEIGGVDDSGHPVHNPILQTETGKSLKGRSIAELKIQCPFCDEKYDFQGIFHEKQPTLSGLICKCNAELPEQYVMNRVNLFLKQLIALYYSGK